MIHFETIRWKNFLSTGNQWTEIKLNRSPNTLIVGENGAGKSTILDALCFALFSKPFRKINKAQLINTINQSGLLVEVEFRIGKQEYLVRRGMKPNVFDILQNGNLLNQPGSSRDYQKQLEDNILKLNFKSFTQIVVLGASTFVPFMQLTAANRREVIEDLLDISIFSNMGKLLKDYVADNKETLQDEEYNLHLMNDRILHQKEHIRKLKEQSDDTISTFQSMIESAEREIQSLTANNESMSVETTKLLESIHDENKIQSKVQKIQSLLTKLENKRKTAKKRINFFDETDQCPTCSQDIEDTIKNKILVETNETILKVDDGIQELEKEMSELSTRLEKISTIQSEISTLQLSQNTNQVNIKSLEKTIRTNKTEIDKIREAGENDKDSLQLLRSLEEKKSEHEKRLEELSLQKEVYSVAANMLKDGGIKTRIIRQYVPIMNKLINKYLAALDFFVSFELDEEFNEVIKSRHRDVFTYASFSEGEKMRIDLALLFTWRAIAKLKNSTNTNLLILDEVFDASLDVAGCDEFLKLIHQLGGETNVFVISHKGDVLTDKFRSQIKFEKVKNFSRIAT